MKMVIFNFSLDQQIDLMIIAWTRTHPPYIFWSLVARNGEPILPLLFQRIADSDDLSTLRPLALCLHDVDKWNFEWTTQPKYVEMFEKAISGKWDPKIQREFLAILDTGVPHPFFKGLKHGKKVNK